MNEKHDENAVGMRVITPIQKILKEYQGGIPAELPAANLLYKELRSLVDLGLQQALRDPEDKAESIHELAEMLCIYEGQKLLIPDYILELHGWKSECLVANKLACILNDGKKIDGNKPFWIAVIVLYVGMDITIYAPLVVSSEADARTLNRFLGLSMEAAYKKMGSDFERASDILVHNFIAGLEAIGMENHCPPWTLGAVVPVNAPPFIGEDEPF